MADLLKLADEMKFSKKFEKVRLPPADAPQELRLQGGPLLLSCIRSRAVTQCQG
jgi:hypothetical protein